MKYLFSLFNPIILGVLAFTFLPIQVKAMPQVALHEPMQQDFTKVAKKGIPAVVSIKVSFSEKRRSPFSFQEDNSDFFQDDFWQRFFRLPKSPGQQSAPVQTGQASGFIISEDGYILTNSHVVKEASSIHVVLNDEREFLATLIGQDPNTDLALLKIEANQLPFLTLGDSDALEVGQWVVAIGNPFGLQASLTVGVVSAKGRNNLDLASIEDFIQTDAAINRGNSGGPLLDLTGNVVGINTAIVTNMTSGGYVGIGFAIPSKLVKQITDQLRQSGKVLRGFLGVTLQQMDQELASAFNLDKSEGALIANVSANSPAQKAGLKQGDLILAYDHIPVKNMGALRYAIALMPPGKKTTLTILREGKSQDIQVEIGTFPTEIKTIKIEENSLGFEVQNLSAELADLLKTPEKTGVVITKVAPGSPAAWIGLKAGVVILEVNQTKINTVEEFQEALHQTPKGKPILFLIRYGDLTRFISFKNG